MCENKICDGCGSDMPRDARRNRKHCYTCVPLPYWGLRYCLTCDDPLPKDAPLSRKYCHSCRPRTRPRLCRQCGEQLGEYGQLMYCSKCQPKPEPAHLGDVIYFIQQGDTGPVKIGKTIDVYRRLSSLQSANPDRIFLRHTIPNTDKQLEKGLHRQFTDLRIWGEWFRYEEPLVSYMRELKVSQP